MFSVILYGVVGMIIRQSNNVQAATNVDLIAGVLGAIALGDTAFIFLVAGKIFGAKPGMGSLTDANYFTFCIIRWAMAEVIAVFGLILLILGGSITVGFLYLCWSFVLLLFLSPNDDEKRKFIGSAGV